MTTLTTRLYTLINGKMVGTDTQGNRYYHSKKPSANGHVKRWVLYHGAAEPTTVPPQWHGWLHYMTDTIPETRHSWQKEASANPTGTENAYFPPGHAKNGGQRPTATGDYEAWKP